MIDKLLTHSKTPNTALHDNGNSASREGNSSRDTSASRAAGHFADTPSAVEWRLTERSELCGCSRRTCWNGISKLRKKTTKSCRHGCRDTSSTFLPTHHSLRKISLVLCAGVPLFTQTKPNRRVSACRLSVSKNTPRWCRQCLL